MMIIENMMSDMMNKLVAKKVKIQLRIIIGINPRFNKDYSQSRSGLNPKRGTNR